MKMASQILKERIMKSKLKVDGVDWRWVLVYLGLTMTPIDKVENRVTGILPRQLNRSGGPPSIKTVEVDQQKERWWYPVSPGDLTSEQKQLLLGCVIEQFARLVFSTHFYEWEGQLFRQVAGGPIGLRATGVVAKIIMDHWAEMVMQQTEQCMTMS